MVIDGGKIAKRIQLRVADTVSKLEHAPVLAVVAVGDDPVMERFIRIKRRFAQACGVHMEEHRFGDTIDTDTLLRKVEDLALDESVHGIVVQLPLPEDIDTEAVLGAIPIEKDVDVISSAGQTAFAAGTSVLLPPVVGAIKEIVDEVVINLEGKRAVVVGEGDLVGKPAAIWLRHVGALVETLNSRSRDIFRQTSGADVLVLGVGVAGFVKPDMIKEGVILLDAGTSEAAGELRGDADPLCEEKCSVFTPVPGGIGPITVAILFKNLISSHE